MQEVHSRIVLGSAGPAYAGIVPPPGATGDDDPFIESLERPQLLGVARVVLNPLAFLVEIDEALSVITYYNAPIGERSEKISIRRSFVRCQELLKYGAYESRSNS